MLERDLLPAEAPEIDEAVPTIIDTRGWPLVLVLFGVVGLVSLRPSPAPHLPERVAVMQSEDWMVDALPGIGSRTRARYLQAVRDGHSAALPNRAQDIARQVFIWPEPPRRTAVPADR